jgi:hypothetical protein
MALVKYQMLWVTEEDTPIPSYKRKYNKKKRVVAQRRTNLDLTNIALILIFLISVLKTNQK